MTVTVLATKAGFADGAATAAVDVRAELKSTTTATLSATTLKRGKTVKLGVTVSDPGRASARRAA